LKNFKAHRFDSLKNIWQSGRGRWQVSLDGVQLRMRNPEECLTSPTNPLPEAISKVFSFMLPNHIDYKISDLLIYIDFIY